MGIKFQVGSKISPQILQVLLHDILVSDVAFKKPVVVLISYP